jgi:hypothetical protein
VKANLLFCVLYFSLTFFERKVKEPQFNNSASAMPKMPITDEEIAALVVFLSPQ